MTCANCHRPTCPAIRYIGTDHPWSPGRLTDTLDCERAKSAGLESQHRARLAELLSSPDCPTPVNMAMDILVEAAGAAKAKAAFMSGAVVTMRYERDAARAEASAAGSRADAFADQLAAIDRGIQDAREDRNECPFPVEDPRASFWRVGWMAERATAEAANGAALRTAIGVMLQRSDLAPWHLVTSVEEEGCDADEWGCVCGASADTEEQLIHATDCDYTQWKALLALPASGSVARVQALVEAARDIKRSDPGFDAGVRIPVHRVLLRALLDAVDAIDAFGGHANSKGNDQ